MKTESLIQSVAQLKTLALSKLRHRAATDFLWTPDVIIPVGLGDPINFGNEGGNLSFATLEGRQGLVNFVPTHSLKNENDSLIFEGFITETNGKLTGISDVDLSIESLIKLLEQPLANHLSMSIAVFMKVMSGIEDGDGYVRIRGNGQEFVIGPFNERLHPKVEVPFLRDVDVATKWGSQSSWKSMPNRERVVEELEKTLQELKSKALNELRAAVEDEFVFSEHLVTYYYADDVKRFQSFVAARGVKLQGKVSFLACDSDMDERLDYVRDEWFNIEELLILTEAYLDS